jgi:hypothetical protein
MDKLISSYLELLYLSLIEHSEDIGGVALGAGSMLLLGFTGRHL